jgi:hypothetical protein
VKEILGKALVAMTTDDALLGVEIRNCVILNFYFYITVAF